MVVLCLLRSFKVYYDLDSPGLKMRKSPIASLTIYASWLDS